MISRKRACLCQLKNTQGFTLIEITLVMSIVIILTVMILPLGSKWIQETTEKDAVDLFVATIYNLQSYSIAHNEYTRLHFKEENGQTYYIAEVPGEQVLMEYMLPDGMGLSTSNRLAVVEFHGNGNIVKNGVLTLVSETKRFAITFQFQRGRMIIHESERVFLDGSDFDNHRLVYHF